MHACFAQYSLSCDARSDGQERTFQIGLHSRATRYKIAIVYKDAYAQVQALSLRNPRLERDDQPLSLPRRKGAPLLAYLAGTGQPHSRAVLATLLWPEANQRPASANLRRMLDSIGQKIEFPLLSATPEKVEINPTAELWLE